VGPSHSWKKLHLNTWTYIILIIRWQWIYGLTGVSPEIRFDSTAKGLATHCIFEKGTNDHTWKKTRKNEEKWQQKQIDFDYKRDNIWNYHLYCYIICLPICFVDGPHVIVVDIIISCVFRGAIETACPTARIVA